MKILEDSLHKTIIGDRSLYEGKILPWSEGNHTIEAWKSVKPIFKDDIYIDAPKDSIANYYRLKGVGYIQIEGVGLFHTGIDLLELGVPFFECDVKLRIRSTKHMKKGISTDITAALQFNRKTLPKTPFNFETTIPVVFSKQEVNTIILRKRIIKRNIPKDKEKTKNEEQKSESNPTLNSKPIIRKLQIRWHNDNL